MAPPKKKKHNLDVFELLNELDHRNFDYYNELPEEKQKGFTGVVAMRWMSAVKSSPDITKYHVLMVNENVNTVIFNSALSKHQGLVYLLLANCGLGDAVIRNSRINTKYFHQWIKGPSKKTAGKVWDFLREIYPTANDEELKLFLELNEMDDFVQMAKDMGYQNDQIKKLKLELKKVK